MVNKYKNGTFVRNLVKSLRGDILAGNVQGYMHESRTGYRGVLLGVVSGKRGLRLRLDTGKLVVWRMPEWVADEIVSGVHRPVITYKLEKRRNSEGEYVVKGYEDGVYEPELNYYTDIWQDAIDTLKCLENDTIPS